MPPTPAKPAGGLDLKRLPKWAWGAAIVVGLLVGYFVLKKVPAGEETSSDEGSRNDVGNADTGGAPVIASPLDPKALLDALGLTNSSSLPSHGAAGDGGDEPGGGASADTSSLIYPNASGYYNLTGIAGPSSTQTTYQGGAVAGAGGLSSVQKTYQGGVLGVVGGGSSSGSGGVQKAV